MLPREKTVSLKRINGKNVLVIGGAGTIGSSYIKALLSFKISKLVVIDFNENGLTELVRDLRSSNRYNIPDKFITYPINFGDPIFEKIFKTHGHFDIVANFAAHKHVRSEKDIFSIEAMLGNNLFLSYKLINLLLTSPPEHFFCVSTDKAANPVNIMGASKKLMEELLLSFSHKFKITTARFANVAFSNGSLPYGFIERYHKRQPWSCPTDVKRYFVSPQESGELCMIASVMGSTGDIFFPKLDKNMISFDSIANDLLKYLGYEADICLTEEEACHKALKLDSDSKKYPVYFFNTDTFGEKAFEEFYTEEEKVDLNTYRALGIIKNSGNYSINEIEEIIDNLHNVFDNINLAKSDIIKTLNTYLPNFKHIEKEKGLDSKM